MIGHFSADDLAGYRAGTITDGRAARIATHLSSCVRCASIDSGLANVSALLASVRAPDMPERLTQRVRAAIADEAAQRAVRTAVTASPGFAPDREPAAVGGQPELGRRRPRTGAWSSPLLLRGLAAAGVLVLVVGGGILLANQRPTGAASSAARPAARPLTHRAVSFGTGSAAATTLRYRHAGRFAYASAVTSSANYTAADLAPGVRRAAANSVQVPGPDMAVPSASGAPAQSHEILGFGVGRLESCLSAVAATSLVLLVEVARYQGQPASIIILKPASGVFHVIVVGQGCGASNPDVITRLAVPMR